ncbi:ATP-dependent helicase [Acinetobacter apis]|uniref:DNA 3'-5' helicase n=1 Tax=Acinetobacter apis TaxID=1229165 RepID=A0A217EGW4_9GAMM|nr:DNA helicase-2 / ATP-dependent DNA helicase PcrA [Acinetobacter apis]
MSLQSLISELNEQQKQAATTDAQHSLVLAGAGCGKTKTIVARAAYLISQGVPASQIQILTFTRRAAHEIVTRVEQYLGDQAKGLRASTFHTFCIYLLRRNRQAFGLEQFSIIDRDDQLLMFRLLRGKGRDSVLPKAAQLADIYSFARNTQSKLSDAIVRILPDAIDYKEEIKSVMQAYESRKQARGFLDYDDILAIVAAHLQASEQLCQWVAKLSPIFLVDEMQDTNPLQWSLLSPLLAKIQLFCVGDDAQSIYGFRGADFKNIHQFTTHVPDATVFRLEHNYRSTQGILDVSNWLLKSSPIHYDKQLTAHRQVQSVPILHIFANEFEEAHWIATDLKQRHEEQQAEYADHMILVRSSYAARHVESALIKMSIPYRFIGGTKLLEAAHVKDLLSVLRVVVNSTDDIAWMRFLTLWDGIGDVGASKITTALLAQNDLMACCDYLEQHVTKIPASVVLAMKQLTVLETEVVACLSIAFEVMAPQLEKNYHNQDWQRRAKDVELVKQLAAKHNHVATFLEEYILEPVSISEVQQATSQDHVTIITIHSAKGTEQKVCYVPHLSVGQYPHARAQGDFDAVEEERRVLYVALTRAQNELILTKHQFVQWSIDQVDEQGRKISQYFLNDLPTALVDIQIHQRE